MKTLLLISLFVLCAAGAALVYGGTAQNPEDGDILVKVVSENDEIVTVSDLYSYSGPHNTGTRTTHLAKGDASDDVHIAPHGTKNFYLGQCQSYTISFMYQGKEIEMDIGWDENMSDQSMACFDSDFGGLFAVDYDVLSGAGPLPPVGAPQIIVGGGGHIMSGVYDWITFYDVTASGGMIERDGLGNPISPVLPDGSLVTAVFLYDVVTFELARNNCPSADLTGDCFVDYEDFALMANQWLTGEPCIPDDMAYIPAGEFDMGDHFAEGGSVELPVHSVYLDSFMMSCFEVTNEQYCEFLNNSLSRGQIEVRDGTVYAVGDDDPYCDTKEANLRSRILFTGVAFTVEADKQYHPMVKVSWFGAVAFCNWKSEQEGFEPCYNLSTWTCDFTKTGFRLPTEAEREYAGRGDLSGKRYPWGDGIRVTSQANYRDSGDPYEIGDYPWTTPVGFYDGQLRQKTDFNWPGSQSSYQTTSGVNGYGLHDIGGNVWEWCNDWWAHAYYASSPGANPQGPADGTYRVSRGGSWNWPAFDCRVSRRASDLPSSRFDNVGFRLALDLN